MPTVLLVKSLMVSTLGNLGKAVARNSLRVSYIATSACRQKGARGVCNLFLFNVFCGTIAVMDDTC